MPLNSMNPGKRNVPIIVGGVHRSGTSLIRRILDAHSRIYCGPETKFFKDWYGDYVNVSDPIGHARFLQSSRSMLPEPELMSILGKAFVQMHERAAANAHKQRWADKNPENVLYLNEWEQLLGDDWLFVQVVRNPLDTLASIQEAGFQYAIPSDLDSRIELYRRYSEAGLRYAESHPERCYRLVYEQLVKSPAQEVERLMGWLGEQAEPGQLDFNQAPHQVGLEDPKVAATHDVHSQSVDRWREFFSPNQVRTIIERTGTLWAKLDAAGAFRLNQVDPNEGTAASAGTRQQQPAAGANAEARLLADKLARETEKTRGLEARLQAIYGMRGWRLINRAYSVRSRLLPAGSLRERLYQRLFRRPGPQAPQQVQPAAVVPARPPSLRTEPILVYQMGKVASVTVQKALIQGYQSLGLDVPVYHVHYLQDLDERESNLITRAKSGYRTASALQSMRKGREVQRQVAERQGECWNVVTLVREPVARRMSHFFHALPQVVPDWQTLYAEGDLPIEELQRLFIKSTFLTDLGHHEEPDDWLENELKRTFGFDVYKTPFPCSEGYLVYPPAPNARLLLIRLEDLDRVAERAMHEFLGLEGFHMGKLNTAQDKEYFELYQQLRKLPLPEQFLTEMYAAQYAQHFYSDAEIAAFKQRWSGR